MSDFDANIARVCVLYVAVCVVLKVGHVLSTVVVLLLCVFIPSGLDGESASDARSVVPIVGDLVLSVWNCVVAFLVQAGSSIVYSMYIIYPFLFLSLLLSVFHDQYDVMIEMTVRSYNRFVGTNTLVVFLRHTLWYAKLFWEMGLPVYNYLVHIALGVNVEVFKAVFFDADTVNVLFSVFTGVGGACVQLARTLTVWVDKDIFACRYDTIAADMSVLNTHECMQFGPGKHRSLELGGVVFALQTVVSQGTLLVVSLCPAVTSFTTALVYPVYDARMQGIVENAVNLVIGCTWTVWDVTHTRCRFAMSRGLPSTLCVPDVGPLFHFAHQIAMDTGELLDNWFNIVNVIVLKFFMERASGFCAHGQYDIQAIASEPVFFGAATRLVALSDSLLAMTDGAAVVFAKANDHADNELRENAFLPAMDVNYGFAGIEFGNSIQHADVAGGTTTALMGCACVDTAGGAWIECHVALYDRVYDPANVESFRKVIPVTFEGSKTGMLMQCSTLRITVQAVRFPHKQYDFMPTGFYGDRPGQRAPLLNCLVDPSKCNDVDAVIYVAPVCTLPGQPGPHGEPGKLGGTLACIAALKHNFCFPYCVGLHQRRSGSRPVTLYSERTLSTGVYMTNMDCSPALERESPSAGAAYTSSTSSSTDEDLTESTSIAGFAAGFGDCRASPTHNSLLRARAGCDSQPGEGTCLGEELTGLGAAYEADRTMFGRVAFAELQPVVVAGDALLIPKCNPIRGGCEWTTSVMRLTSDIQGQYSIQPKLTRVPSVRTDPSNKAQKRVLVLPRETMDYQRWYNPAAQTETGIFYALNPDTRPFFCAIERNCMQYTAQGQFLQTRVLFTEPSYQCTKDTSVKMAAGQQARLCSTNLTREVHFGVEDRFWSYDDEDPEQFADDMRERRVRNLFVEDVQYYNALNVVVTVRRGPVADMLFENGQSVPPPGHVPLSTTVFYFVNTETLEARRAQVWSRRVGSTGETTYGMLCPADSIMPPFGSAVASFVAVLIKAAEIVVNQLVLNVVGVVEAAVSRRSEAGVLCMHGTQDHFAFFPCSPGPLSMRPVYSMFLRFHAKALKCTKASLAYVSYLIDLPVSEYHWSQGAAYAFTPPNLEFTAAILRAFRFSLSSGVSIAANGAIASFYGTVFLYEHLALPFVKRLLFMRYSGNTREDLMLIFYTMSNTVHEAVTSSALDNTLLLPAEQTCISLAMITGDSARPIGQFVEHSCLAFFEGVKAAVRLVPSVFTLTSITNCLCADRGPLLDWASVDDVTAACELMIPPALHAEYFHLIHGFTSANRMNYRGKMCVRLFDRMQTHVNDIPSEMLRHMRLAALASAGIPQQLVSVFNIPGLDSWMCGVWATDIGVVTIVPQPTRVFKKCAYTRTCRAKCAESIDWFMAERMSIAVATKPATTGRVRLGIPMWEAEGRIFAPVLVQDYGAVHGCRRWIAVFGQTYTVDAGVSHEMIFLCQSLTDMAVVDRLQASTVQLPMLRGLNLDFGVTGFGDPPDQDSTNTVHEMWFAPLGAANALTAVLVLSATAGDDGAGLYEVRTGDLRGGSGVRSAGWIVRANLAVSVYTRCSGLLSAATGLDSILEPSAEYPVDFLKFVMAPPELAGGDAYRMFARLTGHGLYATGDSARFNAILEFTIGFTGGFSGGVNVQCRAAAYHTHEPTNLAAFFAHAMYRRNMYIDTRGRLLSIGKAVVARNPGSTTYTVEYHRIETAEIAETDEATGTASAQMNFRLVLVQNFSAGTSIRHDFFDIAADRRKSYSRGREMHAHPRTSAMLTVHDSDDAEAAGPAGRGTRVFSVLESSPSRLPNTATWLVECTVSAPSTARALAMRGPLPAEGARGAAVLLASRHVSISDAVLARVEHTCDYMDCAGCSTLALQRSCYQAQRCAITNCVGTPVNTNNVMCVLGSVARELQEFTLEEIHEGWMLAVELVMGVVRKWMLTNSGVVNVQGISSLLVTQMCGFKDMLATLSAVVPSLYYTIYTGMLGGDASSTAPVTRTYMLVQRSITPLQKLQTTELVTAATSLIFQFSVVVISVGYNFVRIMMCFLDQIVAFASGHINLVINDVGEGEEFCIGGDSSDNRDSRGPAESDAEMLQRAVRDGSLSGVSSRISYMDSASIDASEFMTTAAGMILWKRRMPKIMLVASLSTMIDWLIGLVYGVARITVAAQDPECDPTPQHMQTVVNCVCGDDAYDIAPVQAASHADTGALWCVGVLRMVDATGMLVYVRNTLSMLELTNALDSLLPEYLTCISTSSTDDCVRLRTRIDRIQKSDYAVNSVTAINVITQCRANYAAKTWDEGLFAVFNPQILASVLAAGKISREHMDLIKKQVLGFLCGAHEGAAFQACDTRGAVTECLRLGPEFNSIQHCMSLHFALETTRETLLRMRVAGRYNAGVAQDPDLAATPQDIRTLNKMEYFEYAKRAPGLPTTNADACAWASAPSIQAEAKKQCDSGGQQCAHGKLTNPTVCSLNMVQGTSSRSATSNPVSLFMVVESDTERSPLAIVSRYEVVRNCSLDFMTTFLEDVTANKVLENLEYDVLSFEGDMMHRLLDCVVLGPLEQLDMLPSLDSVHVEQLTFSRDNADARVETGASCPTHVLTNTEQNVIVDRASEVCGSGPRIAALSYIARDIHTEEAARQAVTALISARLQSIKNSLADIGNYGCSSSASAGGNVSYAHCCPGGLESGDRCNFYPDALDLRTTIPASDIIKEIHGSDKSGKLQFRAIYDQRMWTKYRTTNYSASIDNYNNMLPELRSSKVSFPVQGVLDESDLSYTFPFTRAPPHNLSTARQCHALLRVKAFSAHFAEFEGDAEDEGMLTLPAIKEMLARGEQWLPLRARGTGTTRADMIHRLLASEELEDAFAGLYDARFVSLDSRFCPKNATTHARRRMGVSYGDLLATGSRGVPFSNVARTADSTDELPMHGLASRSVGAARAECPCFEAYRGGNGELMCSVSLAICALGQSEVLAHVPQFQWTELCEQGQGGPDTHGPLPISQGPHVRAVLARFSSALKANRAHSCPLLHVSDLWGVLPGSARAMRAYLNSSQPEIPDTSFISLMMHTRSGATLSNIKDVDNHISHVLGEGDRAVHLTGGSEDADTRVENVLCVDENEHVADHARVARVGFPAVSAVAESPVVLECLRYIIEVSWLDMLEAIAGEELAGDAEGVARLRAQSAENIDAWGERCNIKLRKLDTCHFQAAYEVDMVRDVSTADRLVSAHGGDDDCPYTEDPADPDIAIMHTECLAIVRGSQQLWDVRQCAKVVQAGSGLVSRDMLEPSCLVASALQLLQQEDESALPDTPLLSAAFVRRVVSDAGLGSRTLGGVLGLRADEDFLFPNAHASAEAQCFPTVPYWPVAWQAPFGEVLSDSLQHATGFSNYMMLVCTSAEGDCNADGKARVVLMPDHLRVENMTSTLFGTGGFCREHSFAMPLVRTNTHSICTASPGERAARNDQSHSDETLETAHCSSTPRVSGGGGTGPVLGNMWPLLRHFVQVDAGAADAADSYIISDEAIERLLLSIHEHTDDGAYDILPAVSTDEDLDVVVGTLCTTVDNYQESPTLSEDEERAEVGCTKNTHCSETSTRAVCNAAGMCVNITVEVTHEYPDAAKVELGLSVPTASGGCGANTLKPPASPWEQYASFMEQHGMCSHNNAISYQRMLEAISTEHVRTGVCRAETVGSESHFVCQAEQLEWDWTTLFPWNWRGQGAGDTLHLHKFTQTVAEARAFELEPHACDADYMHTPDVMHMCDLATADTNLTSTYWMRHARRVGEFTTMNMGPPTGDCFMAAMLKKPDCSARDPPPAGSTKHVDYTANKLRFMALKASSVNFQSDDDPSTVLQTCAEFGVCQPEFFTFGGVHSTRHKAGPARLKRQIADTKDCLSIGYMPETPARGGRCVLDKQTAALAYVVMQSPQSECAKLYRPSSISRPGGILTFVDATGEATYSPGDSAAVVKLLNKLFWIHPDVRMYDITRELLPEGMDSKGKMYYTGINACAREIQRYLDHLDAGEEHSLLRTKTSGLYYFYEYGTYEVPLLWWLKYGVQTVALDYGGAATPPTADVVTFFALDAYDNRARQANLQNMWNGGFQIKPVSLKTLWARANTMSTVDVEGVRAVVSAALSAAWSTEFANSEYELRCPLSLSLAPRTYTPRRADPATHGQCVPAFEHLAYNLFSPEPDHTHTADLVDKHGQAFMPTLHEQFSNPIMGISGDPTCEYMYNAPRSPVNTQLMSPDNVDQSFKLIYHVIASLLENADRIKVFDPFDGRRRDETRMGTNTGTDTDAAQIPIASVTLSMNSLTNAVEQDLADIVSSMLGDKQGSCKADAVMQLQGQPPLSQGTAETPCIYNRFERASMQREGVNRGWKDAQTTADSTMTKIFAEDATEPVASVQVCARTPPSGSAKRAERKLWGRQHPNREDGMPCSIADAIDESEYTQCLAGCSNIVSDYSTSCHLCARASVHTAEHLEYVDIVDSTDTSTDRMCNLDDNTDRINGGPLAGSQQPQLLEQGGSYVYNADVYRKTVTRINNPRRGVCHRIDSGCVTRHDASKLKSLFKYDAGTLDSAGLTHPVQAAYERVNRNAYTQVSVPRLEEHHNGLGLSRAEVQAARVAKPDGILGEFATLDDLSFWWKRDMPMDDIETTSNPAFYTALSHTSQAQNTSHAGMQCNVRRITVPPTGIAGRAFLLNEAELPRADVAHLLYNDRLAFTRHDGRQLLFGHHFHRGAAGRANGEQNTMGAPPWSFCETDARADQDGAIHWFRPVNFQETAEPEQRVRSNLYRWDQRMGYESTDEGISPDTSTFKCKDTFTSGSEKFFSKPYSLGTDPQCMRLLESNALFTGHNPVTTPRTEIPCVYKDPYAFSTTDATGKIIPQDCKSDFLDNSVEQQYCIHMQARDHTTCGGGLCCGTKTYDVSDTGGISKLDFLQERYCKEGAEYTNTAEGRCEIPRYDMYGATQTCKCYQEPASFMGYRALWKNGATDANWASAREIYHATIGDAGGVTNRGPDENVLRFDSRRTRLIADKFVDTTITTGWTVGTAETQIAVDSIPNRICKKAKGPFHESSRTFLKNAEGEDTKWLTTTYSWGSETPPVCADFNSVPQAAAVPAPSAAGNDASTCSHIPNPDNEHGFKVFDLAVCWEQDVYEKANIRPWWSLSIGEMMTNFMDQSTSKHALTHWLGFAIPATFTMRDLMYPYYTIAVFETEKDLCWMGKGAPGQKQLTDEDRRYKYCDVKTATAEFLPVSLENGVFLPDAISMVFQSSSMDLIKTYIAGWPNMVAVVGQSIFTAFHQRLAKGADTPPLSKILGRHLWLFKNTYKGKTASHPLRFAPCIHGFSEENEDELENAGYRHLFPAAQLWDTRGYLKLGGDKKRFITKPTQWAEMDGSPGSLLVACHPDCVMDLASTSKNPRKKSPDGSVGDADPLRCAECRPLLVKNDVVGVDSATGRKEWTPSHTHGACSYSLSLEVDHHCSSFRGAVFDETSDCVKPEDAAIGTQKSFYPVAGQEVPAGREDNMDDKDTGAIFKCGACLQYDAAHVVLTNSREEASQTFQHCAGCGLYRTAEDPMKPMLGPFSSSTLANVTLELVQRIKSLFKDPDALADTIASQMRRKANRDFAEGLSHRIVVGHTVSNDAIDTKISIVMSVDQGDLVPIDTSITRQFEMFGTNDPLASDSCKVDKRPTETSSGTEACAFRTGFNSEESGAHDGAYHRRMMITQNCVESEAASTLRGEFTCTPDVNTNIHLGRLRDFAQKTLRETYGMQVPTVSLGETRELRVAESMDFAWVDGVLPFYTDSSRGRDAFVRSLLKTDQQCTAEYRDNINIATRPCIKDQGGDISVVNPWLGGNYSFYKAGYEDTFDSDETKVLMGFDMCQVPDAARAGFDMAPCAARACLSGAPTDANISVCKFSTAVSGPTRLELPPLEVQYKIARVNSPTYVYTPRPANSTCERQFARGQHGHAACSLLGHRQAPLGYFPDDIVHGTTPSAPGPALAAARLFKDELWVSLPGAGLSGTGLAGSLWAGGNTRAYLRSRGDLPAATVAGTEGSAYALLAVRGSQLAPDYVRLAINAYGILAVSEVGLRAGRRAGGTMPAIPLKLWPKRVGQDVQYDNALIDANPVYNTTCIEGSACAPQHWACAYVNNALFGGSAAFHARHPRLRLMTPDPPRMRRLFGRAEGLGRAHPLVAVRDIELAEMHEYAQIGNTLFVRRDCATAEGLGAKLKLHLSNTIRNTAFAFTAQTELAGDNCPVHNTRRMDWPWVHMLLRSGEAMPGRASASATADTTATADANKVARRDKKARMQSFKIWVSTKGSVQHEPPAAGGGFARTTLDRGGDCHREYIPRVTEAELSALQQFEKCHVVHSTHAQRTLECENAFGAANGLMNQTFTLNTTRPHTRTLAQLHAAGPRFLQYQACASHAAARRPNTSLYAGVLGEEHMLPAGDAELSLSRRQRISPLWSLVEQRTRKVPAVHAQLAGAGGVPDPRELWAQSAERRAANPRWQTDAAATNRSGGRARGMGHMVRGADATCVGLAESVDELYGDEWSGAQSSHRDNLCLAVIDHMDAYKRAQSCSSTTISSRDFDICSLTDMQPLCAALTQFSMQVAGVNAWARRQTEHTAMLYTPSVFMRGDGMFVWHAVASSYDELGFIGTGDAVCPDINVVYSTAAAQGALESGACPGRAMISAVEVLEQIRGFVVTLVQLLMLVFELVLEFLVGVVFSLLPAEGSRGGAAERAGKQFQKCFDLLADILTEFAVVLYQLMQLIIRWIDDSPLSALIDVIEFLCKLIKSIGRLVLNFVLLFVRLMSLIPGFNGNIAIDRLESMITDLDNTSCRLIPNTCGGAADENCAALDEATSLVPSFCGIESLGDNGPRDVLNAYLSPYQCMPTSHCLVDATAGYATLCASCAVPVEVTTRTTYAHNYKCDMGTKQCMCGPPERAASSCYLNLDCKLAGAVCSVKGNIHSIAMGTEECVGARGTSFCYREGVDTPIGECTAFSGVDMQTTAGCLARELGLPVYSARTGVCLGTHNFMPHTSSVEEHALFLYRCASNFDLSESIRCMTVAAAASDAVVYKAVWSPVSARGARRLLDTSGSATGGGAVVEFLRVAAPRLDAMPASTVCKAPLRGCLDAGAVTAECKSCAAHWLFWNITLDAATSTDTAMLDAREAAVQLLLTPTVAAGVAMRAPHALLVLLEDWLHNAAAFRVLLEYLRSASAAATRFHDAHTVVAHTVAAHSVTAHSVTAHSVTARRALLQAETHVVFVRDKQHADIGKIAFVYGPAATKRKNLVYNTGVLELPTGLNCIVTGSAIVNNILYHIIKSFEREGWTAKRICDGDSTFVMTCPLLDGAVGHVIDSTRVLVKYYMYLAYQTPCMVNMHASCLPPPAYSFKFVSDAFPRIRHRALTPSPLRSDSPSPDFLIDGSLAVLRYLMNAFTVSRDSVESAFLGFVSLDPMYDDVLYASMRGNNEFSIGSIARDLVECDLDETLSCRSRNSPLLVIVMVCFFVIGLTVVLLPIPSVFVFLMWTLGMTIGVVYLAYGFSPMCAPRIPICLGEGLFDIVQRYVLPERLVFSHYLYDARVCSDRLERLPSAPVDAGPCLLSCVSAPISVDRVVSVFVGLDCAVFQYKAIVTRFVDANLPALVRDLYNTDSLFATIGHFEAIFAGADEALKSAVHVCLVINMFKLVLTVCVLFVLIPICFYALQFVVTITVTIFVKTLSLVFQLGQGLHGPML